MLMAAAPKKKKKKLTVPNNATIQCTAYSAVHACVKQPVTHERPPTHPKNK